MLAVSAGVEARAAAKALSSFADPLTGWMPGL
jgi:hypothetical protein